eukprot:8795715-Karenia_brevis.AAC.1
MGFGVAANGVATGAGSSCCCAASAKSGNSSMVGSRGRYSGVTPVARCDGCMQGCGLGRAPGTVVVIRPPRRGPLLDPRSGGARLGGRISDLILLASGSFGPPDGDLGRT